MSLTLRSNFNTVTIGGRSVKLVETFDNRTVANRFVETLAHGSDEAAVAFAKALAVKYGLIPERNSKYLRALDLTGRI